MQAIRIVSHDDARAAVIRRWTGQPPKFSPPFLHHGMVIEPDFPRQFWTLDPRRWISILLPFISFLSFFFFFFFFPPQGQRRHIKKPRE